MVIKKALRSKSEGFRNSISILQPCKGFYDLAFMVEGFFIGMNFEKYFKLGINAY